MVRLCGRITALESQRLRKVSQVAGSAERAQLEVSFWGCAVVDVFSM